MTRFAGWLRISSDSRRVTLRTRRLLCLSDRASEGVPHALLHRGRGGPALLDTAADDGHLVRVELRGGLEHLERLFASGVLAPVEDADARLGDALVDLVEHDVLL